ncbi:MAG: N-acetylmuramoyl-L-alanine amidase [Akkermansiaceae bacterium]
MSFQSTSKKVRLLLIGIPIALLAAIGGYLLYPSPPPTHSNPPSSSQTTSQQFSLAALGLPPDWSNLDKFQNIISKETFLSRLQTIYTKDDSWKKWISIDESKNQAVIGDYQIQFSPEDKSAPGSIFDWKTRSNLSDDRALPLEGLIIAIDPGHIGGDYALIEEREYKWENLTIREGSMTLKTAKILKPLLEKLGASVTLVRSKLEPVTRSKAKDFTNPKLFYRTSEIRARANLVNQSIKPDLVICLHFNGSESKTPVTDQHFHIILNGTYTAEELAHEDERFEMLQRLLSGTIIEEIPLAREIAAAFNKNVKLPAYRYPASSRTSQKLANHPNLWARNLLANRLYQCPVIFMEPFVMNSSPFIALFREDPQKIYRKYAQTVADGVTRYYSLK